MILIERKLSERELKSLQNELWEYVDELGNKYSYSTYDIVSNLFPNGNKTIMVQLTDEQASKLVVSTAAKPGVK